MTLAHIVAVSKNDVIGVNNDLPWSIPEDMAFFKEKTKGHMLIMGRKTFESVPTPLPNCLSIVITRSKDYSHPSKNVVVVSDLAQAIAYAKEHTDQYGEEVFIAGGGEIYKESMGVVDTLYVTRIHADFKGDVRYPTIDPTKFELVESRDRREPVPFTFQTYIRRK